MSLVKHVTAAARSAPAPAPLSMAAVDPGDAMQAIYDGKLLRLPSGVYTPGYDDAEVGKYIHGIFNSEEAAEDYTKRYKQHDYFRFQIKKAIREAKLQPRSGATILDIGSGSGNTVFPALEIFPESTVVATDLSIHLLAIMLRSQQAGRIHAVQQNAEALNFLPGSFDHVIGGAILHHLFNPEKAIRRAAVLLKPGGSAMFFEPCLNGQVIVKLGYERVLLDPRSAELDPQTLLVLRRQIHYIKLRLLKRANEHPEVYANLEDKWLFSKPYMRDILETSGVREIRILPLETTENLVQNKVLSHFKLLKLTPPQWVVDAASEMDREMPMDFKLENPTGMAIVFRK